MFVNLIWHFSFEINVTVVEYQCNHSSGGLVVGIGAGRPRKNRGAVSRRVGKFFL